MSDTNQTGNHPLLVGLAATLIVVCCIGAYVWIDNKPPVHAGEVLSVSAYPIHRELSTGSGLGGVNGSPNIYDEVIVIANVRIRSKADIPLFLHDMWGDVTLSDGSTQRSLAASTSDYHKVFVAYPQLAPQQREPVLRDLTLSPGQQVEGQLIFHYPISGQQWDQRKSFNVVIEFLHQKDLVLTATPGGAAKT